MKDIIILVPVYNDVDCVKVLCEQLAIQAFSPQIKSLVIVDDGSDFFELDTSRFGFPVNVIRLHANMGHQKALAIGLSYINRYTEARSIVVMDADGEDSPDDILKLLAVAGSDPSKIVLAGRRERKEGIVFQLGYQVYRRLFRLLTGYSIRSGNFMVIPGRYLKNLVFKNDIWNHLSASIIKSKLPVTNLPLARQARFGGESKMSFTRLIIHGLGAITVFIDHLSARLLMGSLILLIFTSISIATIVSIRIFTNLAIPGWASVLTGVMFIIFLQSFLLTLSTVVLYLSSQSQRQFIPGSHFSEFIANTSFEKDAK